MQEIRAKDVAEKIKTQKENFVLLDCREKDEVELTNIAGSLHIPMGAIPLRLHELNKEHEIVVYCRTGKRSQRVALFLEQQGFKNIANMTGGIHAWSDEVDSNIIKY